MWQLILGRVLVVIGLTIIAAATAATARFMLTTSAEVN